MHFKSVAIILIYWITVLQFLLNRHIFRIANTTAFEQKTKMATRILTCYGLTTAKLFFDGNESKYELWEVKFLGYLRIQQLHQIIPSPIDHSDDMDL